MKASDMDLETRQLFLDHIRDRMGDAQYDLIRTQMSEEQMIDSLLQQTQPKEVSKKTNFGTKLGNFFALLLGIIFFGYSVIVSYGTGLEAVQNSEQILWWQYLLAIPAGILIFALLFGWNFGISGLLLKNFGAVSLITVVSFALVKMHGYLWVSSIGSAYFVFGIYASRKTLVTKERIWALNSLLAYLTGPLLIVTGMLAEGKYNNPTIAWWHFILATLGGAVLISPLFLDREIMYPAYSHADIENFKQRKKVYTLLRALRTKNHNHYASDLLTSIPIHLQASNALGELKIQRTVILLIQILRYEHNFLQELSTKRDAKKIENTILKAWGPLQLFILAIIHVINLIGEEVRLTLFSKYTARLVIYHSELYKHISREDWIYWSIFKELFFKLENRVSIEGIKLEHANIAKAAINALGKLGDIRATKHLVRALDLEEINRSAAKALGELGDPNAVMPLIHTLSNPNEWVRINAVKSLGEIGDLLAREPLALVLLNDQSVLVRQEAKAALKQFAIQPGR